MTALNINIEDFLRILIGLRKKGIKMINLDMLPDDGNPAMNKLIVHAVPPKDSNEPAPPQREVEIKNPEVRLDNNDIFNLFNGIV